MFFIAASKVGWLQAAPVLEAGRAKLEDLQAYVPNFTMTESSIGTEIDIRGIGSGREELAYSWSKA